MLRGVLRGIAGTSFCPHQQIRHISRKLGAGLSRTPPPVDDEDEPVEESPAAKRESPATDTEVIFNQVFADIELSVIKHRATMPREIIWLNGAPGAGKGTNTPFILKARDITAPPIIMSDMLRLPEFKEIIDRGDMIEDRHVCHRLFKALMDPMYREGVLVDGFPRTNVQVEMMKMFQDRLRELRRERSDDSIIVPKYKIVILYVSEKESIARQLNRGKKAMEANLKAREKGTGAIVEERLTDFDEKLIAKRYEIFANHRRTLLQLRDYYDFHIVDAEGDVKTVEHTIMEQFAYQSSSELNEETYRKIERIPLAHEIANDARSALLKRLMVYNKSHAQLFTQALAYIELHITPVLARNAFSGRIAVLQSTRGSDPTAKLMRNSLFTEMVVDILSERGFRASIDLVDSTTRDVRVRLFFPPAVLRRRLTALPATKTE